MRITNGVNVSQRGYLDEQKCVFNAIECVNEEEIAYVLAMSAGRALAAALSPNTFLKKSAATS